MEKTAKPKLLMLYAAAGAGHKQASFALAKACAETSSATAEAVDILDFTPGYFRKLYIDGYLEIVKSMPEFWGYLYDRSYEYRKSAAIDRIHDAVGGIHLNRLLDYVHKVKPDAIVFTHFLGSEALSGYKCKKAIQLPFYCVVTDFAVHSIWISSCIDKYYVGTEGERRVLKRHGFKDSQIKVTGIPVDPAFSSSFDKREVCRRLKFDPNLPIILMISGRYNMAGYEKLLASFKDVTNKLQIIVLAGRDKILTQRLSNVAKGIKMPVRIYGLVDNMPELMAISDIVVSKPGGLTTSEVLASSTLMAVIDPIPGQEQRNSDYLLESGVAIRIHDMDNAGLKLEQLLYNPRRMKIMNKNLQWVSHPRAAYNILTDIVADLRKR